MLAGDDLSIFLFWATFSITFGYEAVKRENAVRRGVLFAVAVACMVVGIFWPYLGKIWEPLSGWAASIGTNPQSWLVLVVFIASLLIFHGRASEARRLKSTTEITASENIKVSLQPTYGFNGPLNDLRIAVEFLCEARNVRVFLDFRQRGPAGGSWNDWTRVTLITKDYVAKKEWIYKNVFRFSQGARGVFLNIESDNDFDGQKRAILENYFAECVLIIFYEIDGNAKECRTPFAVSNPFPKGGVWPDIVQEIKLDFRGMD